MSAVADRMMRKKIMNSQRTSPHTNEQLLFVAYVSEFPPSLENLEVVNITSWGDTKARELKNVYIPQDFLTISALRSAGPD